MLVSVYVVLALLMTLTGFGYTAPTSQAFACSPGLSLTKSANPTTYDHVGQVITYTYRLTNSGDVALSGPFTVTDDKVTVTPVASAPATLAPGAHIDFTATHTMDQADLDAGFVKNTAQGHGRYGEAKVDSNFACKTVTAVQSRKLTLEKSTTTKCFSEVGDVINYSYKVTNSGNVTLHGSGWAVIDDKATVDVSSAPWWLAPGESFTVSASYTVTQADCDAGKVTNVAYATGYFGDTNIKVTSNEDCVTVHRCVKPALSLTKSADPMTYDHVGQVISYSYRLTNSGNVTLSGPFTVTDDKATASPKTPPAPSTLAPGAYIDFVASYTITQADVDAGSVKNTAQGHGRYGETKVDSNLACKTITAVKSPKLTIDKTTTTPSFAKAGDVINYSYKVTNSGNVTLTKPWAVIDDKTTVDVSSAPDSLVPGASFTVSASYTVKQADCDAGKVTNVAYATGHFGETKVTSNEDSVTVDCTAKPMISVTKVPSPASRPEPGGLFTFTYVVKNEGPITVTLTSVHDSVIGDITLPAVLTLAPGASSAPMNGTKTYTEAGTYPNTVNARAVDNSGDEATATASASVTVTDVLPKISVTKVADPTSRLEPGGLFTFTYVVTNNSVEAVTLTSVNDSVIGDITLPAVLTLAPGASSAPDDRDEDLHRGGRLSQHRDRQGGRQREERGDRHGRRFRHRDQRPADDLGDEGPEPGLQA